jgi:AbrB family looped-hinge helix DNA binding protein
MAELPYRVIVKSDGRLTIPENIRKKLGIKEGSVLELKIYGNDKILITVLMK